MNYLTEAEAKAKRCPYTMASPIPVGAGAAGRCVASDCMAWKSRENIVRLVAGDTPAGRGWVKVGEPYVNEVNVNEVIPVQDWTRRDGRCSMMGGG